LLLEARPKSILVVKPSSLGDIVHTLPAVAAVRDANPGAEITWVINPEWAPLLRGNPDVDHVHIFPRGQFRSWRAPTTLLPWLRQTRKLRPDAALDFQGLLRSALIARWSRASHTFGLSDAREGSRFLYDTVAAVDRKAHAVERYLKLAERFGAAVRRPLRFSLPTGDPLPRFDDHPAFVLLHPFARGGGKSLSSEAIGRFCVSLAPVRVVLVGTTMRRIPQAENCIDVTNQTTLLQLMWLIRRARWVVSVDSGPMHIAAAVTPRLVSIHSWTDPRRVGPYNADAWVWKNGELIRVGELANAPVWKKRRPFRRADVDAIVQLIGTNWSDAASGSSLPDATAKNEVRQ
jgi:ADP-heptose:LPS heptosyltransferase